MHGHQGWNVRHGLCHIYLRYVNIWVVYSFCFFCCLFIIVTWWYVWCIVWASGNQEEVQACLVTLWLFIISWYSLYKTTLDLLCSWKPAWSLKKHPHSMRLKPFVKMCIFVVIQSLLVITQIYILPSNICPCSCMSQNVIVIAFQYLSVF